MNIEEEERQRFEIELDLCMIINIRDNIPSIPIFKPFKYRVDYETQDLEYEVVHTDKKLIINITN